MTAWRWVWVALATGGCDLLLGLDTVQPSARGDGGGDTVPPLLDTHATACAGPLHFGTPTAIANGATDFSIGGTGPVQLTAGTYYPSPASPLDFIGTTSSPLGTSMALQPMTGGSIVITPRLAPDVDEIFAREIGTTGETIDELSSPDHGNTWTQGSMIALPSIVTTTTAGYISTPTTEAMTPRSMLYADPNLTGLFYELQETDPGSWTDYTPHAFSEVDAFGVNQPNLSADGKRMVFAYDGAIYLSTRPGNGMRFSGAVSILAMADVVAPYLAEDCSSLYFSTFDGSSYVLFNAAASP